MAEKMVEIRSFKGINDYAIPENDPSVTRSLNAVYTKQGRIIGAPGIELFDNIKTAAASTIIALMPFYTSNLATTLYRMLPAAVQQYSVASHSWTDVTGTALNGFSYTLPQFVVHKDTLCFINEGLNRPRKLTGSGNSADLAASTAPHSKMIFQAWGFLFLGNVSTDGGTTFDPRGILYSDDFDNNWDLCNGNTLTFNETNGGLVVAAPVGEVVVIGKSDAIMRLEFVGGQVRFNQFRIPHSQGVLSPRSFQDLRDLGIVVFLATDNRLQFCSGYKVDTVPAYVQKKLDDTMDPENAQWSMGAVYPDKDTYSLFYQSNDSDGIGNQILMNFRTGEFAHREYPGYTFTAMALARRGTSNKFYMATDALVYEESNDFPTDNGIRIDRYYDIDWNNYGINGEKYLKGVEFACVKKTGGRISVSVAADDNDTFLYEKFYTIKDLPGKPSSYARIVYRIDPGLRGSRHKIRIRLFHDETGAPVEIIPPMKISVQPLSSDETSNYNIARAPETRVG